MVTIIVYNVQYAYIHKSVIIPFIHSESNTPLKTQTYI